MGKYEWNNEELVKGLKCSTPKKNTIAKINGMMRQLEVLKENVDQNQLDLLVRQAYILEDSAAGLHRSLKKAVDE